MIDHVSVYVTDVSRARDFYLAALAPTGYELIRSVPDADSPVAVGLGIAGKPDLWLIRGNPSAQAQHVAIRAQSRKVVSAFHAAALAAGGKDNGAPGPRPYHAAYFGAFILDPDGHNLEVCCHEPYID